MVDPNQENVQTEASAMSVENSQVQVTRKPAFGPFTHRDHVGPGRISQERCTTIGEWSSTMVVK